MASSFDEQGNYSLAYRSAIKNTGRHMQFLTQGTATNIGTWDVSYCPVTTAAMTADWVAFETEGRLFEWHPQARTKASTVSEKPSPSRQKHPAMAINKAGQRLIVWGEAGGYFSGGQLNMKLVDAKGEQQALQHMQKQAIPEFSTAAVAPLVDGSFLVVH